MHDWALNALLISLKKYYFDHHHADRDRKNDNRLPPGLIRNAQACLNLSKIV